MKVTMFGTQPYDQESFDRVGRDYGFGMVYHKSHLNADSAVLAEGSEAVCIFVNDEADAAAIAVWPVWTAPITAKSSVDCGVPPSIPFSKSHRRWIFRPAISSGKLSSKYQSTPNHNFMGGKPVEQKIKQDSIRIGENIRRIRLAQHIKQTQLVQLLQLEGINMTRETLVKIERGVRHIEATQLRGIRDALHTTYDELFRES